MTTLFFIKPADVYLEIGPATLKARQGALGLELPLERQANGQLAPACRERVVARLRKFLRQKSRFDRARAFCAIGAQGVSLRRISLPPAPKENLHQMLALQIEKEFPLPPQELSWACLPFNTHHTAPAGATQDMLVVALKRDVIADYTRLLRDANLNPSFTLGALAAHALCPDTEGPHALLNIGPAHAELLICDHGVPTSVRCLPWGERQLHESPEATLAFAEAVCQIWSGPRLYLAGQDTLLSQIRPHFANRSGRSMDCQAVTYPDNEGNAAAILGLRFLSESSGHPTLPILQATSLDASGASRPKPAYVPWAALAVALALACLGMRYLEIFAKGPALTRQIALWDSAKSQQPAVDRELSFYQYLATNRPPYLAALAVLSDSAGRGTVIHSLSVNRQGDLSLRGQMPSSKQATDFRTKLVHSGWFSEVVLEEQAPAGNDAKVNVRISARWKPPLANHPTTKISKSALPLTTTEPTSEIPENQEPAAPSP